MINVTFIEAVLQGNAEAVAEWLSQTPPIDINQVITHGEYRGTALHCAIRLGYLEVVEALLVAKPDMKIQDKAGLNPVLFAFSKCVLSHAFGPEIFMALVQAGADLDFSLLDIPSFFEAHISKLNQRKSQAEFACNYRIKRLQSCLEPTLPQETRLEAEKLIQGHKDALAQQQKIIDFEIKYAKTYMRPVIWILSQPALLAEFLQYPVTIPAVDLQNLADMRSEPGNTAQVAGAIALLTKPRAFSQLFSKIQILENYGEQLQKEPASKHLGLKACELAENLKKQTASLIEAVRTGEVNNIKATQKGIQKEIDKGMYDMSEHRELGHILANIAIALTGIGAIILVAKYAIDGYGFFLTNRQKQVSAIGEEMNLVAAEAVQAFELV